MAKLMYPVPSGSSDQIAYNTQTIWDVGQQVVKDAGAGQQAHFSYKKSTVDSYLENALRTVDGFEITRKLLTRHVDRLGNPNPARYQHVGSYNWQVQMGNTLKFIAAGIDEQENNWANSFKAKVPR